MKLTLESITDLERYLNMKTRIQDQMRKIEGEPDITVDAKIRTTSIKETIKKYEKEIDKITEEVDT